MRMLFMFVAVVNVILSVSYATGVSTPSALTSVVHTATIAILFFTLFLGETASKVEKGKN